MVRPGLAWSLTLPLRSAQVAELMSRVGSMLQIATFATKADSAKNMAQGDVPGGASLVDAQFDQPPQSTPF